MHQNTASGWLWKRSVGDIFSNLSVSFTDKCLLSNYWVSDIILCLEKAVHNKLQKFLMDRDRQ